MQVIDHTTQSSEDWRKGVRTQMQVSALTGSTQLTVFEQWCDPGIGAPTHLHAVEEILTLMEGEAEVWVEGERQRAAAGHSVLIPAGYWHGFRNIGTGILRVRAILAAPIFEASYEDRTEVGRRWVPQVKPMAVAAS
jgi:quercetin dioxygenase-like cupin family protein